MAFKNISNQVNFPALECEVLEFWKESGIFEKSLKQRKGGPEYVFYDGPPFATGLPHYGHLLAGTIKDVVPRYQTMRGNYVERSFGWDCHGLPVENEMEKVLKLQSKRDIEAYGVDKFNEACRSIVLRYTSEWETVVTRMGRWVDFRRGYRTMDRNFMESVWWVFKALWDKGLVYEGYKILPYCPRCATPLSNFETNQGYKEVVDPAITIRFKLRDEENSYILAWTTTPWTLPSNLALAVGPEVDYVKVKDGDEFFYLAENRLGAYYRETPEIVWRGKGADLAGRRYEPLFNYFAELDAQGAFQVLCGDFVSISDGTGIVHCAPGFGEDDNALCKAAGLPEVCPIDAECRFTDEIPDYAGRAVKETDKEIIQRLKDEGKLVRRDQIRHSYPHCWRDDGPLIYRTISTWFVRAEQLRDRMVKNNQSINWVPAHLRDGRFGKWLENARDWAISRNRFWGTPLPIWRNPEGEVIVPGSVAELEKLTGRKIEDLHKHFIDKLEIPSPTGKSPLKRVEEVFDCWFESGSMPYARMHYPFENKKQFEEHFPADFIAEGLDQTRGWFYTLVVLASALFDRPPFKNVLVNGLILAENGQKMSKRLKNYPDPMVVVNTYGADALRLFMLGSQVVRAEDLKFSEAGVKEILRGVMIPMWNALSFFTTYANVDGYEPPAGEVQPPAKASNVLDRWILSSASQMVEEIRGELDAYNLQKAANRFSRFIDDLTNWYIRRSRRRFWKSSDDADKREAYRTLHYVLLTFAKTAAPFIPFTTEAIYRTLRTKEMPESVHLCDYPEPNDCRDEYLEKQMELTMTAVSSGRFLRTANNLKVRQPLAKAVLASPDAASRKMLEETAWIVAEELNVKSVEFSDDEEALVRRSAKANFKVLGSRLGKNMKEAAAKIQALTGREIGDVLAGKPYKLVLADGTEAEITAEDLVVQREEKPGLVAASENGITIALATELTPELEGEGFARELVSKIQNLRKEKGFDVTDRIRVVCLVPEKREAALEANRAYICEETLAVAFETGPAENGAEADVNGESCRISVERA
ncbi:isoleucine--tRNA ligase [Victivallaceae bacterium BBE-744-WT-12]|uniref:Isoleucine--tRNA ligase n=1 Tax=Victivallis lenta TaxID=2606640 RepID=A0A844FZ48_9BACT|nr:isoleucine--tRNA ligase [Victivallis lenta]MST95711.1 isoleucine--tRNA ligase [Victivallis lenta]